MRNFWHNVFDVITNARNRTMVLATIASFLAWITTELLRAAFG
jgi:hypothetical protein